MLAIISPNTLYSKWVPWEIGYDHTTVNALTLKGIKDPDLSEYLKTVKIFRGTKSLNGYLSSITGKLPPLMESLDLIKSHAVGKHPLDHYLNCNL
ncbi:hypothetical protein QQ020_06100 [Fulvivirgaceae bacterium BMA12]|uniref:TIR domain-containing protein n=1 Tax=Agaribacillus aureus TaxID=3051825 RepID=A0ABT8L588_9BACT|nr:hypothetical protein [Fulvivirgaceae bacterium BMA12]